MMRQHRQHIMMEPEGETLFNLCILLLDSIEQVVEWCQSDVSVCLLLIGACYEGCLNMNGA